MSGPKKQRKDPHFFENTILWVIVPDLIFANIVKIRFFELVPTKICVTKIITCFFYKKPPNKKLILSLSKLLVLSNNNYFGIRKERKVKSITLSTLNIDTTYTI